MVFWSDIKEEELGKNKAEVKKIAINTKKRNHMKLIIEMIQKEKNIKAGDIEESNHKWFYK